MNTLTKLLAGGAGLAALATAVPASAQYYPYAYGNTYGSYGYGYGGMSTQAAASQCTAAVQNRLYSRTGLSGIIGSLFGMSGTSARVLGVTSIDPNRYSVRVKGIATSGRYAYNPYGSGYYGALGAGYTPDLGFRCDVDYRGYVRNVDIYRR
jgi:hypothetical protein